MQHGERGSCTTGNLVHAPQGHVMHASQVLRSGSTRPEMLSPDALRSKLKNDILACLSSVAGENHFWSTNMATGRMLPSTVSSVNQENREEEGRLLLAGQSEHDPMW